MSDDTGGYPPNLPDPHRGYLLAAHVAALFERVDRGRGREASITPESVLEAVRKSRPGQRYEGRPLRAPSGYVGARADGSTTGLPPFWEPGEGETLADVEAELMAWRKGMPGRGVGGGRPRKDARPSGSVEPRPGWVQ